MGRNPILLTAEQRQELERFCKTGVHSVKLLIRARIILELDTSEGRKATKQEEIVKRINASRQTGFFGRRKRQSIFTEKETGDPARGPQDNRRGGSEDNCAGVRRSSQRLCEMDVAVIGG